MEIVVPAGKNYTLRPIDGNEHITFINSSESNEEASSNVNGNVMELHNKDHEVTNTEGITNQEENKKDATFTVIYDISLGQSTQISIFLAGVKIIILKPKPPLTLPCIQKIQFWSI